MYEILVFTDANEEYTVDHQYGIDYWEQCRKIIKDGFSISKGDCEIYFPAHRIKTVTLRKRIE